MQNKHETNFENTNEQLNDTLAESTANSSKKKSKSSVGQQNKPAKYVISAVAVDKESVLEAAPIERKVELGRGVFTPCDVKEEGYSSSTILINGNFKIYAEPLTDATVRTLFNEPEVVVKSTEVANENSQSEEKTTSVVDNEGRNPDIVEEKIEETEAQTVADEAQSSERDYAKEILSIIKSNNSDEIIKEKLKNYHDSDIANALLLLTDDERKNLLYLIFEEEGVEENGVTTQAIEEEKTVVDTDGVLLESKEIIEEIAAEGNETEPVKAEPQEGALTESDVELTVEVQQSAEEQITEKSVDEVSATEDTDTLQEAEKEETLAEEKSQTVEVAVEQTENKQEEDELDKDGAPVYEVSRDFKIKEEVSVSEATKLMSDEDAKMLVEEQVVYSDDTVSRAYQNGNKAVKDIINIDVISANFKAGDHVNLNTLKEHKLIGKKTTYIKVLARGYINKPLIVEADAFSIEAIKMIVLTGGRVIRKRSK